MVSKAGPRAFRPEAAKQNPDYNATKLDISPNIISDKRFIRSPQPRAPVKIMKEWFVKNTGKTPWPHNVELRRVYQDGHYGENELFTLNNWTVLPRTDYVISAGHMTKVFLSNAEIEAKDPGEETHAKWRLFVGGKPFGDDLPLHIHWIKSHVQEMVDLSGPVKENSAKEQGKQ